LNPDFLGRYDIVDASWKVVNAIVLPPFSEVAFDNGVKIRLEQTKCTVLHSPCAVFEDSPIPQVCERLLGRFADMEAAAVGSNFKFALVSERADQLIWERIFGKSEQLIVDGIMPGLGGKLIYPGDPQLMLSFESATLAPSDPSADQPGEKTAVVIDVNVHRQSEVGKPEETIEALRSFLQDWERGFGISRALLNVDS
jgi:hypothetical protein